MKITSLEIDNFKRIRAVSLKLEANGLTIIGGKNGQGKTSVLDAIAFGLGGKKYAPTNASNGKDDPYIRIETDDGLIIERKGKNSDLTVKDDRGMKGGQNLLTEFLCELALNLPKFLNASQKDKATILLNSLGIKEQVDEIDRNKRDAYDDRRDCNRDLKKLQASYDLIPDIPDAPTEQVDVGELAEQLKARTEENEKRRNILRDVQQLKVERETKRDGVESRKEQAETEKNSIRERIKELESDLIRIEDTCDQCIAGLAEEGAEIDQRIDLLGNEDTEILDTTDLTDRMESANAVNAVWNQSESRKEMAHEIIAAIEKAELADEEVKGYDSLRRQLLTESQIPIDGLDVDEGSITYKGQHWDCMSGSEQLIVAVSIIKSIKPDCQFVLMDRLEQMDSETLAEFASWAEGEGLQVIATRVSTGDECTIVIEDGNVRRES